ncbi:hypothetical protein AQPE_3235 [Aquipluma nitroreducens]|uniref:Uncharacterized protein n=1 Tax=Aquipluma nitroreducens TaxID=2010828 RepID=A0A5K7SBW3_9BACT|nr:hypothetical protein [Aquipluma nitroreducens]BBE19062.1 hypothetical protein AQPE_3235 [Aquipluma nitroreducens]
MELLIKNLIERLSNRKRSEMAWFEKYKREDLQDLMLISSGRIMEIDHTISELKSLIKNKPKNKNYYS